MKWVKYHRQPSVRRELLDDSRKKARLKVLRQTTAVLGQRLHALLVLCEKLSSDPILVPSGQEKARIRTHLVVHPRQAEQDARNELAGRLVNPPKEYLAHVRLPGSRYHEVKLSEPVSGVRDIFQLEEVRRRSRSKYTVSPREDESTKDKRGSEEPSNAGVPIISRRPPRS
jgi:hypothetical protein